MSTSWDLGTDDAIPLSVESSARAAPHDFAVATVFAYERDAVAASHLITHAGIWARFRLRPRRNPDGEVDLVVLETTLGRPADRARVVTLVQGVHGAVIRNALPTAPRQPSF